MTELLKIKLDSKVSSPTKFSKLRNFSYKLLRWSIWTLLVFNIGKVIERDEQQIEQCEKLSNLANDSIKLLTIKRETIKALFYIMLDKGILSEEDYIKYSEQQDDLTLGESLLLLQKLREEGCNCSYLAVTKNEQAPDDNESQDYETLPEDPKKKHTIAI